MNYKLFKEENGKVMAKALGLPNKKHKPRRIWVPKCIVDLERATKLKWVLKAKTQELDGGGPSANLKIMTSTTSVKDFNDFIYSWRYPLYHSSGRFYFLQCMVSRTSL